MEDRSPRPDRRPLPRWATSRVPFPSAPVESRQRRIIIGALAWLACILFFVVTHTYWVPANGGVDQNGYLAGGKQFAHHLSTRFDAINPVTKARDPYMFVGMMWIGVDFGDPANERWYPKYPIGLPVLVAIAHWIGGDSAGPVLTYYINPLAMAGAMLGVFFIVRMFAGSFIALVLLVVTMSGPNVLAHTNNPNSHSTTLFCVTWGMFLLLRWAQSSGKWKAIGAGFLLGYAVTIRYTEGLLLLPIALVIFFKLLPALPQIGWAIRQAYRKVLAPLVSRLGGRLALWSEQFNARGALAWLPTGDTFLRCTRVPRATPAYQSKWLEKRNWLESILVAIAWCVPVGTLVIFNLLAFRALTGYDPSNESSGFTIDFFDDNWETMLRHINQMGLFFIFPIGVLGLSWMFRWSWKVASVLWAWMLPCVLIYMLYYWAPDGTHVGYLRFVLTIFPAFVVGAGFLIGQLSQLGTDASEVEKPFWHWSASRAGVPIAVGVLAAVTLVVNADSSLASLEGEQRGNLTLRQAQLEAQGYGNIPAAIPEGSAIFGTDHILDHLQLVGNWHLFHNEVFNGGFIRRYLKMDPDAPQVFQPQRAKSLYEKLKFFSDQDFVIEQQRVVKQLLDGGVRVFFVWPRNGLPGLRTRFSPTRLVDPDLYQVKTVRIWNDPNVNNVRPPSTPQPRKRKAEPPVQDPRQTAWCIVEVVKREK